MQITSGSGGTSTQEIEKILDKTKNIKSTVDFLKAYPCFVDLMIKKRGLKAAIKMNFRGFFLYLRQILGEKSAFSRFFTDVFFSEIAGPHPYKLNLKYGRVPLTFILPSTGFELPWQIYAAETTILEDQYCTRELLPNLDDNRLVLDIGANVGMFTAIAAKVYKKRVAAFEPVPETFEALLKNITLNGISSEYVKAEQMAASNREGTVSMSVTSSVAAKVSDKKGIKVKATSIDSYLRNAGLLDGVSFVKIDAEGHEKQILHGLKNTIRQSRPILVISAYHRPDDRKVLPEVVKKSAGDYKAVLVDRGEEDFIFYPPEYSELVSSVGRHPPKG